MGKADYLKLGDWNVICDRCGEKYKASKLKKTWDNLYVCSSCWEPRHPQDKIKGIPEDQSTPWTRPEGSDSGGTDINGNTIPPTFVDVDSEVPTGTFDGSL